ncbi:hypothetical protein MYX77_13275, partial [Acidobacteriia bacterium AH_259_A11_L15]|nr:hypothetical protein [Acidobacteriia bacterium AH_259_A11_L15]
MVYRKWVYPPKPTPEGKIGIWVARIVGDVGNRRQAGYIHDIDQEIRKHSDLASVAEVCDLKYPVKGDPKSQREKSLKLAERFNAAFLLRVVSVARVGGK